MSELENAEKQTELPEIDFSTFIISLATSVHMQLGILDDPNFKGMEPNIDQAKQTIDIIGLLQEKTKGNLSKQEEDLMTSLLHELRMVFIEQQKNLKK